MTFQRCSSNRYISGSFASKTFRTKCSSSSSLTTSRWTLPISHLSSYQMTFKFHSTLNIDGCPLRCIFQHSLQHKISLHIYLVIHFKDFFSCHRALKKDERPLWKTFEVSFRETFCRSRAPTILLTLMKPELITLCSLVKQDNCRMELASVFIL